MWVAKCFKRNLVFRNFMRKSQAFLDILKIPLHRWECHPPLLPPRFPLLGDGSKVLPTSRKFAHSFHYGTHLPSRLSPTMFFPSPPQRLIPHLCYDSVKTSFFLCSQVVLNFDFNRDSRFRECCF